MLVDNPLQPSPFVSPSNDHLAEFLNMDLFSQQPSTSGPAHSASSRDSSQSPSAPFSSLPSPPHSGFYSNPSIADPTTSDFFNILFNEDFRKSNDDTDFNMALGGMGGGAPYDFLAALGGAGAGFVSPESTSGATSFSEPFSIDPLLVGTPSAASPAALSQPSQDLKMEDSSAQEEEPELSQSEEPTTPEPIIAPVKVGGRGKAGRKGTVQSGGIAKKSPPISAVVRVSAPASATATVNVKRAPTATASDKGAKNSARDEDDLDAGEENDDWRPSPEEYKKMSSKEKRQLRNKISARNFRVRRKEYISTLEGDIAERDRLIDAIRTELGSTKSENDALRQEVTALKKALLVGRSTDPSSLPSLPPPGPIPAPAAVASPFLSPSGASVSFGITSPPSPSLFSAPASPALGPLPGPSTHGGLLTPNVKKDLPTSPRVGSHAFWGGASNNSFGGFTPVHTTLIPESFSASNLSGKPAANRAKTPENMNPNLNSGSNNNNNANMGGFANMGMFGGANGMGMGKNGLGAGKPFDAFAESNMFTMKMLDAYRMQLWTRMGQQQQSQQQQQSSTPHQHPSPSSSRSSLSPSPPPNGLSGLAANMQPHYFTNAKRTPPSASSHHSGGPLSALLSGKHLAGSSSGTTAAPFKVKKEEPQETRIPSLPSPGSQHSQPPTRQEAMVAAMASQTLFGRLGGAFWEAFSGSSSASTSSSTAKAWDADKVKKVLEGKAVVRVVDVDAPVPAPEAKPTIVKKEPVSPKMMNSGAGIEKLEKGECTRVTDILEESMRALTLGKK